MESKAIRLTNKTAVALRENAKKTRNAYFIVGAAGTLALLGAAVYFGMQWLPAVPLLLAAAVAMASSATVSTSVLLHRSSFQAP